MKISGSVGCGNYSRLLKIFALVARQANGSMFQHAPGILDADAVSAAIFLD